jgi:Zn finger protein HypA/HybF involved in hydrogenase expression
MEDLLNMKRKRRGMKCVNCGAMRLMTGGQRKYKTYKPICKYCGSTRFEIATKSKLHDELAVVDGLHKSLPKVGSGKKRLIR